MIKVDSKRRRGLSLGSAVAVVGVTAVLVTAMALAQGWWSINLFGSTTVDRSAPAIVQRLQNLSEYRAASGRMTVVVDVEHNVDPLPAFIAGDRTQYSAIGDVGASVDLGGIDAADVTRASDGTLVVTVPHAKLEGAVLDPKSHVMNRDRGMLDRLGGLFVDSPTSDRTLEKMARQKLEAAARQTDLKARAERNTERMIRGLAAALGVEDVEVRFGGSLALNT